MNEFRITITMSFRAHHWDEGYKELPKAEKKAKKAAFDRTDAYYAEHDVVQYIKQNPALSTVENLFSNAEVVSAKWDPEKFQIHMLVETDDTAEEVYRDLEMNSLEDGEYEACGDTPWILFTRGEEGEPLGPPWDMTKFWEYGLVDYRQHPIEIQDV